MQDRLYEDDTCLCFLDTNPVSPGHCLIILRCHFPSLVATPPSVVAAMCSKVPYISKAVMKATGSDSFNLLVNNGVDAGQVIFHGVSGKLQEFFRTLQRFLGHFQAQDGNPQLWELDPDQYSSVYGNGQSMVDEKPD